MGQSNFEKLALPQSASLRERLRSALQEDLGAEGDVTSQVLVTSERTARARLLVKADGVLSGGELIKPIFEQAAELIGDHNPVEVTDLKHDGQKITRGDVVAEIRAGARTLLAGERTMLNLVCHLSGVASQTAEYVARVAHTRAKILDTRKTVPLWRDLQKYAVRCGGGANHRLGLHDMVLIKDNHLALWGFKDPAGAVETARSRMPNVLVQVEVTDLPSLQHVCRNSTPNMVLLDNFAVPQLREAVQWCDQHMCTSGRARPLLEASGGITLQTLAAIAETGVDRISVGALTHSVKALDLSLELEA